VKNKIVATSICLFLTIGLVFFACSRRNTDPAQAATAEQTDKGAVQTASVELTTKGYQPDSLSLRSGVPARITFVRRTDETCGKELVIRDYDINRPLPLNEPVVAEFTPRKGEFKFGCGMGMLKGKVIVR